MTLTFRTARWLLSHLGILTLRASQLEQGKEGIVHTARVGMGACSTWSPSSKVSAVADRLGSTHLAISSWKTAALDDRPGQHISDGEVRRCALRQRLRVDLGVNNTYPMASTLSDQHISIPAARMRFSILRAGRAGPIRLLRLSLPSGITRDAI